MIACFACLFVLFPPMHDTLCYASHVPTPGSATNRHAMIKGKAKQLLPARVCFHLPHGSPSFTCYFVDLPHTHHLFTPALVLVVRAMAEAQIDPALLDEGGSGPKGRGVKRKAQGRTSGESATAVPARTSSRLATGRGGAIGVGVGVGVGVGAGSAAAGTRQKGKGKEVHEEEEPSRGEEENLIGSEYKLRGVGPNQVIVSLGLKV